MFRILPFPDNHNIFNISLIKINNFHDSEQLMF